MEQNHGRNSLLEKELKKGVVKSTAPIGLIITALGKLRPKPRIG